MNQCHFIGRLTRDPEIRYTSGESSVLVAAYTLAIDRRYQREGEPMVDFLDFVAYEKAASFAEKYLKKGMKVAVTARCQKRSYINREGRRVYVVEFILKDQEFVESKRAAAGQPEQEITDQEELFRT